jgi:hypothetical protein
MVRLRWTSCEPFIIVEHPVTDDIASSDFRAFEILFENSQGGKLTILDAFAPRFAMKVRDKT